MASSSKVDPGCFSDVVSVGNVQLHPYVETDANYPRPHATAYLTIDVLTSTRYKTVTFQDVQLILEIVTTDGTPTSDHPQWVGYSTIPNSIWGVPSATDPTSWDESVRHGTATTKLRLRSPSGVLLSSRPNDGLSHYIGVTGLSEGASLAFTVSASASRVSASAASCAIQVKDLQRTQSLTGYLS